jgi:aryl-alcohol dehydrogenase-like predicted oxidoreductase
VEYRSLGRTGLKVSVLCLGTVKFGRKTNEKDAFRIIDRALDAGINFIDTARAYDSEPVVGRALERNGRRGDVVICTKITPMANDRASIARICEESLSRLRTDCIDVLLLHRPNPEIPIEESLRGLDDLVRAGKVRYIGTSGFKAWQILEGLQVARDLGLSSLVTEQAVYSLLCRWPEIGLIPMCRSYGVGLMLWSPLGAGVLTDAFSRGSPPGHVDLSEREWQVLETAQGMAREKGCTTSQLALAWCLAQPGVTCPIAGPSRLDQLEDDLGALDIELTQADLDRLDEVSPPGWTARQGWFGWKFGRPSSRL